LRVVRGFPLIPPFVPPRVCPPFLMSFILAYSPLVSFFRLVSAPLTNTSLLVPRFSQSPPPISLVFCEVLLRIGSDPPSPPCGFYIFFVVIFRISLQTILRLPPPVALHFHPLLSGLPPSPSGTSLPVEFESCHDPPFTFVLLFCCFSLPIFFFPPRAAVDMFFVSGTSCSIEGFSLGLSVLSFPPRGCVGYLFFFFRVHILAPTHQTLVSNGG